MGVGGWEREGPRLGYHFTRACEAYGIRESDLEDVRGYRLPMRGRAETPVRGRAMLVGDAAGLVDPLSGDGIYEAGASARLAARAALDLLEGRARDLEPYAHALARALYPLAAASWRAKLAFDRFPRLSYTLARTPVAWRLAEAILRGDVAEPGSARGPMRVPLRAIELLGRAAA